MRAVALTGTSRLAMWPACQSDRNPRGEVAEWLKAADCKSARASVRWFESSPLHHDEIGCFLPFSRELGSIRMRRAALQPALAISRSLRAFPSTPAASALHGRYMT